jgi:hypothetical protein
VKPRKVKGLDPETALRANAALIVRTRLEELRGFAKDALDPEAEVAQHDMRIAAKRLRYVLELTGGCFGEVAEVGRKGAKALQTVLGDIHDCDVMLPRVQERIERLRAEDSRSLLRRAGGAEDLEPALLREAPNRSAYRGLDLLIVHLTARRALLFERFRDLWARQQKRGIWAGLEAAL